MATSRASSTARWRWRQLPATRATAGRWRWKLPTAGSRASTRAHIITTAGRRRRKLATAGSRASACAGITTTTWRRRRETVVSCSRAGRGRRNDFEGCRGADSLGGPDAHFDRIDAFRERGFIDDQRDENGLLPSRVLRQDDVGFRSILQIAIAIPNQFARAVIDGEIEMTLGRILTGEGNIEIAVAHVHDQAGYRNSRWRRSFSSLDRRRGVDDRLRHRDTARGDLNLQAAARWRRRRGGLGCGQDMPGEGGGDCQGETGGSQVFHWFGSGFFGNEPFKQGLFDWPLSGPVFSPRD